MKRLNLGCGRQIKEGWINVDIQKAKGIDKSFNFDEFPYPFKENTFDYILVDNVLEHLIDLNKVINELRRISKKGATIEVIVPYWNAHCQANDWTHRHALNEVALQNLFGYNTTYRYDKERKFEIISLNLIPQRFLRKWIPRGVAWGLAKFLNNIIVNMNIKVKVLK